MECRYTVGITSITVVVGTGVTKAAWDEAMATLRSAGASLEPARGVGDGGFFYDERLYTHTGTFEITITPSYVPGADVSKSRADALALANALIPKLKR